MTYRLNTYYRPHGWRQRLWAHLQRWLSTDYELKRRLAFVMVLVTALVAFELFNFSTTDYALTDLLGDARFASVRWATILAIAFCGIDFAGLARLFTPGGIHNPTLEVWYLLGAWVLGATLNAMMTWWAVSLSMVDHTIGNEILTRDELLTYVPIFIAVLVWLTRMLIIGTFSVAGDRLFENAETLVGELRTPRPTSRPHITPAPTVNLPRQREAAQPPPIRQQPVREPVPARPAHSDNRSRPAPPPRQSPPPPRRQPVPPRRQPTPSRQQPPRQNQPPRYRPTTPPPPENPPELEYEDLDAAEPYAMAGRRTFERTNGHGYKNGTNGTNGRV